MLDRILAAVHLLSAAAWFGALVYRAFFVDPRAARFFRHGPEFERFSLDLAHGMRLVVLSALLTCGLSGFALLGLKWNSADEWQMLMAVKAGLWAVAFALFAYISWVFWPNRVFATAAEWPRVRRQGFWLALTMIGIAGLGTVLGQLARG
jgi:putative copper export protein